jgi:hypothetical protein
MVVLPPGTHTPCWLPDMVAPVVELSICPPAPSSTPGPLLASATPLLVTVPLCHIETTEHISMYFDRALDIGMKAPRPAPHVKRQQPHGAHMRCSRTYAIRRGKPSDMLWAGIANRWAHDLLNWGNEHPHA